MPEKDPIHPADVEIFQVWFKLMNRGILQSPASMANNMHYM